MFITRYLDLFWDWVSLYNFLMKIFFIASSSYILYLMKIKYRCVHPSPPRPTVLLTLGFLSRVLNPHTFTPIPGPPGAQSNKRPLDRHVPR